MGAEMHDEQRRQLREWAVRLRGGPPELAAAGRAISLLLDELERVESELDARREAERAEQRLRDEREARRAQRERSRGGRAGAGDEEPREMRAVAAAPPRTLPPRAAKRPTPRAPREREARRSLPSLRASQPVLALPRLSRSRFRTLSIGRPSARTRRLSLALVVVAMLAVTGLAVGARYAMPDLAVAGPPQEALLGAAAAETTAFEARVSAADVDAVRWSLDGEDATAQARRERGRFVFPAATVADGEHELRVSVAGRIPGAASTQTWRFAIDRTPPALEVDPKSARAAPTMPVRLRGRTEPDASVSADGRAASVRDGVFAVSLAEPPARPVELVATDRYGNRARKSVRIMLVPRRPRAPLRAVHVTFHAWADRDLRAGVMRLVDEGRINAVQLDLKDESGIVGFDADIPLARRIASIQKIVDLPEAIELLHARGVQVIGRIVAFRDPVHAAAAWKLGRRAEVVQAPGGAPYAGYGGFTNFANPAVRQYNIDVALRAAEAGIDDILYDYIRRPDGPTESMVFPGLKGTPEQSIATFLAEARRQLKPYRVFLGASVFGVAATRPREVAQDIPAMARHADYIAPMLYPSHWGPGEYDVADPNSQPFDIVARSLRDFQAETRGTGARVVPWLQDFSLGVSYGPAEVRAQIRAARSVGIREWILWDPIVTYTADALDAGRRLPPVTREPPGRLAPAPKLASTSKPAPAPKPAASGAAADAAAAARDVEANELGLVPVLMYHQIRADGGGDYDLTPAEFRAELERLYREGYRPIRAVDLATGRIDIPAGTSPVVLTFDDSTKEQLAYTNGGKVKPDTAIGILLDVAEKHPDFEPAGTFYVNREPFAGVAEGAEMLRWLHASGFELGNHTRDHIPFGGMSASEVQRQLATGKQLIVDAVPGAKVRTLSLPLGVMPDPPALARRGRWNGISYQHAGVFLVGAEPAPSPFAASFRADAIPRIRPSPPGARDGAFGSSFWLDELKQHPERRYVSDGDPARISFPRARGSVLAPRFRGKANPY
jgi:hypothetical protein